MRRLIILLLSGLAKCWEALSCLVRGVHERITIIVDDQEQWAKTGAVL